MGKSNDVSQIKNKMILYHLSIPVISRSHKLSIFLEKMVVSNHWHWKKQKLLHVCEKNGFHESEHHNFHRYLVRCRLGTPWHEKFASYYHQTQNNDWLFSNLSMKRSQNYSRRFRFSSNRICPTVIFSGYKLISVRNIHQTCWFGSLWNENCGKLCAVTSWSNFDLRMLTFCQSSTPLLNIQDNTKSSD